MKNQKGFTLKELVILLMIIAVLGIIVASPEAQAEFSIAGGQDFLKNQGAGYAEIRWRGTLSENGLFGTNWGDRFGYSLYAGDANTYGVDVFQTWDKFMFGLGVEAADNDINVVASTAGYELLFEWAFTEHWAVSYKHRSNCRQICRKVPGLGILPKGSENKTNGGFNFLMVRYTF